MTSPASPANYKWQAWESFTVRKLSLRQVVACPRAGDPELGWEPRPRAVCRQAEQQL